MSTRSLAWMKLHIAMWDIVWPVQSWQVHLQSKSNSQGRAQAKKARTLLQRVRLVRNVRRPCPTTTTTSDTGIWPPGNGTTSSSKGSEGPNILKHTCSWRGKVSICDGIGGVFRALQRTGIHFTLHRDCLQWDVEHLRGLVLLGGLSKLEELFWNVLRFQRRLPKHFVPRELLDFVSHGLWDLETLVHVAGNLKFLRDQIGNITWQIQEDSARSSSHRHAVDKHVDLLVPLSRV